MNTRQRLFFLFLKQYFRIQLQKNLLTIDALEEMDFEAARFTFLSDVLVAVAVLKLPIDYQEDERETGSQLFAQTAPQCND